MFGEESAETDELGVSVAIELDLGLALDVAGEVTSDAPRRPGVVETPHQIAAEVAPGRVESTHRLEYVACRRRRSVKNSPAHLN